MAGCHKSHKPTTPAVQLSCCQCIHYGWITPRNERRNE